MQSALCNRGTLLPRTEMHYLHHHGLSAPSSKATDEISSKEFSGEIRSRREKCKRAKAEKRREREAEGGVPAAQTGAVPLGEAEGKTREIV